MLQAIRDRLVGWVAWGILILISVPFIFMGVTDFAAPAKETTVAQIGEEIINQQDYQRRFQSSRQSMQSRLGANYRPDLFDDQLRQSVIDAMIEEKILAMLVDENNLQVGDKELSVVIRQDPEFQKDNKFNYKLYKTKLGQSGFTPDRYESYLRDERKLNVVPRIIRQSGFVTPQEAARYHSLLNQKRSVDYAIIGPDHFQEEIIIQDEDARAYYDKTGQEFIRPEQVKFEYIRLNARQLVGSVDNTEENMRRYYEENIDSFIVEGQRKASHILLSLEDGKSLEDSPEVANKLQDIQGKLESGESFEALAKSYSDDSGSAQNGGDLGQVLRGDMVPPFEEALFALADPGQISGPVRSSFGIHLIRLDEITPRQVKSFDEVRDKIAEGFAEKQAVEKYYDQAEKMAEISYENPDSLLAAAEALGIKVQMTDWLSANNDNVASIEGNKDVLRAAFSDSLKTEMTNSDPIEVGVNDVVILRVTDTRSESKLAFEDVIDKAREAARTDVINARVSKYAEELLVRVQTGESLQDIAEKEKLSIEVADNIQRQGNSLPAKLSRQIFSMSQSAEGKHSAGSVALDNARVALVVLRDIVLPDAKSNSGVADALRQLDAARDAQMVLAELREKAKVVIFKDKL